MVVVGVVQNGADEDEVVAGLIVVRYEVCS